MIARINKNRERDVNTAASGGVESKLIFESKGRHLTRAKAKVSGKVVKGMRGRVVTGVFHN